MPRFALLLVLFLSTAAVAEDARYVVVQAKGWVEAVPDTLLLPVTIKFTGSELTEVRAKVDKVSAELVKLARQSGIAEEDIDSSRLSLRPEYEWRNNSRHYLGQTVEREVRLKVRELDSYGQLVQQLTRLDLHEIRPPQLSHSKLETLQLSALEDALARGQRKAAAVAARLQAELGPVLQVLEQAAFTPAPQQRMMAAEAMSMDAATAPSFSFAAQRINAQVEMRYALQ